MTTAATDRARLVGAAYATPAPLAARAALYQYQDEPLDIRSWLLDLVEQERACALDEHSRVLDVGCGPGAYLAALHARRNGVTTIGFDLSAGMARAARADHTPTAIADAMQIPARAAQFDLVICAHMLYHVPDIARAASELARVVKPDGIVAIVTNGARHLLEIDALTSDAIKAVTGNANDAPSRSAARFLLDDAPDLVAPALAVVRTERANRTITVPDPAPVIAYVGSTRSLYEFERPVVRGWDAVVAEVDARATAAIARDGAFVVHSDVGVLLCRAA